VLLVAVSAIGCDADSPGHSGEIAIAQHAADQMELQAEILVARDLLRGYATQPVVVDSLFAVAEQAPGAPSGELRPRPRTEALRHSLARRESVGPPVILRLSKPRIAGAVARLTVTIDFPDEREPGRRGYETVDYTLERTGSTWRIGTRLQLGIS